MRNVLTCFAVLTTVLAMQACGSSSPASQEAAFSQTPFVPVMAKGTIKSCHDGDTCNIDLDDGGYLTVRFAGIDAPEVSGGEDNKGQPFGKTARDFLNNKIKGKKVRIAQIEKDPYDRMVAEIFLGDTLINMEMVKEGLAEAYKWAPANKIDKKAYADAEKEAKNFLIGVWSQGASYVSPADFRNNID